MAQGFLGIVRRWHRPAGKGRRQRPRWRPVLEELETRLTPSTYYVDQVNGSATGDGSAGNPFNTITAGNNKAVAGDTVLVSSGTYNEMVSVKNSGTASAPVTFTAAPGATVTVTGGADGFKVSGRSYVQVVGFHVTGTTSYGIYVINSSNVSILNNEVSYSGQPVSGQTAVGIKLTNSNNSLIDGNTSHHNSDSGIQLSTGSTGDTVSHNQVYANAQQFQRAALGIDVRSPNNTIAFNVCHDNEDSGIQFVSSTDGSSNAGNCLAVGNVVYNNGDHGIDNLRSTGERLIGNTVYNNLTAGINLEGGSTGGTVEDNVCVNNGLNTSPRTKGNIRVDAASQPGAVVDYNLVNSPAGNPLYTWGTTQYTTPGAFQAASGQGAHDLQADPLFADAAGGDFHLLAGSPAIDSADSGASGETATDLDGNARVDDPATPNTGAGPSPYYDRGAFEYQLPTLAVGDASAVEGNSGTTAATFTVTLSAPVAQPVTVQYATANGTAVAPGDYVAASGTLTFAAGQTSQTVTVAVKGDTANEPDETFFLNLSAPTNAAIADGQGVGTILNDDATLAVDSPTYAAEGDSGFGYLAFTVSLTGAHTVPVTVNYATANGTATSGADFGPTSGTLTFAPSDSSQTVLVPVVGDTLNEADETFKLKLSGAVNAAVGTAAGTGTIVDDDPLPTLAVGDVAVAEGNSGTTSLVFTVSLSAPSGRTVTVAYATADDTATAGSDYTAASGTLTFSPGATSKKVTVAAAGDTTVEPDEDFDLNLSAASGATIARGQAVGTLLDDDPNPLLFIADAKTTEGNAGTTALSFVVSLSAASATPVTVSWATAPGTATAGTDYTSAGGVLTIPAGKLSKTVNVTVQGDTLVEPDETFFVTLSNPSTNAGLGRAAATGTIQNDDSSLAVSDASVVEGDAGLVALTFTVTLTGPSSVPVTVHYATADGSTNPAAAGTDYVAASGDLTFAAGETSKPVTVWVIGDRTAEADEQLNLKLTNPVNAVLGDALGIGTILNDD